MPRSKHPRRQKRIPGMVREQISACVNPAIKRAVARDAARYGVAKSFVEAVILAKHYGIEQEQYE